MKLLFVYQNYHQAYTGLGLTLVRALKKKLPETNFFQVSPISKNRLINRVSYKLGIIRNFHFNSQNQKLIRKVRETRPDAILIFKGSDLLAGTLKTLREDFPETQLACFNPDDPFNPGACSEEVVKAIQYYHHYFIWSRRLMPLIEASGADASHYLQFGTDREIIFPVGEGAFLYDVSFVGNGDQERFSVMSDVAEEVRKQNAGFKVAIFGAIWSPIDGIDLKGQLSGTDYLRCVNRSKININILRKQNKGSTNMRTFEIPATGSFMMHEASDEAREIFAEGKEAVYFSSGADLVEKAKYYLANESLREKIARAGYEKATAYEQSYEARVDDIFQQLFPAA